MLVRVSICMSFFKIWSVLCACLFISCKDFKNWKSSCASSLTIQFEPEKDLVVPGALKNLSSERIQKGFFVLSPSKDTHNKWFQLSGTQTIPLNPDANEVSFTIENEIYYRKITVRYERVISLISPEAGGLQQEYIVRNIELHTNTDPKNPKRHLFTKFKIEQPVLRRNKDKNKHDANVTLYY